MMVMFQRFDTAPSLSPDEAMIVGGLVILGGIALFAGMLLLTRWLARR
ncbi:MAG: hypothetical protein LDL39_04655 [Magnetospirillum sp.]|nr:hypothetical protein [Magnetospirillum sp.]